MHGHAAGLSADAVLAVPFVSALLAYGCGVLLQSRRGRPWPVARSLAWTVGVAAAASGFVGPLAEAAHEDHVAHMGAHLLVGMAAPVLLVLGAPVTLALRSLPVVPARRLARMLRSAPVRALTSPAVAAVLAVGGLWVLYTTPLYALMRADPLVHLFVMTHLLLAGYLFTAAIVPVDPAPHRARFALRMGVLIAALAAHGILAKALYAAPPAGVGVAEGRAGAMLMYYGGDVVDVVLLALLCAQGYAASGRALRRALRRARPPHVAGTGAGGAR